MAVAGVQGLSALAVTGGNVDAAVAIVRTEGLAGYLGVVPRMINSATNSGWGWLTFGVLVGGGWYLWGALDSGDRRMRHGGLAMLGFGLLLLFGPVIRSEPWWPLEQIGLTGRVSACPGYVVGSQADGRWLVVLTADDPREVIYLPSDAITIRAPAGITDKQLDDRPLAR